MVKKSVLLDVMPAVAVGSARSRELDDVDGAVEVVMVDEREVDDVEAIVESDQGAKSPVARR